jgi:hypothetical protein
MNNTIPFHSATHAALTARRTVRADSFVVEIIMLNDFCSISSCTAITSRAAG